MPKAAAKLIVYKFHAMGGPCALHLYLTEQTKHFCLQVAAEVIRIEKKYSRYLAQSCLSQINKNAYKGINVDSETAALLNYAQQAYQQSDGLFDITSGALRHAWDFKSGKLPQQKKLDDILQHIGWHKITWDGKKLTMPKGMEIDFGGIGKEYAVDCAIKVCHQLGLKHGLIDLGGDLSVVGPHLNDSPWRIGIRHPRQTERTFSTINLSAGALASSGDYERYMMINGQRYCHILNPETGFPISGIASISIQAEQCLVAGTLATITMLKGLPSGHKWVDALNTRYLLIDDQLNIYSSEIMR